MSTTSTTPPTDGTALTRKDFASDQEVRWCPGCGDYAILKAVQSIMPELGIPREKIVFVSGIGCSSRFPYYMNTYGFHTIHGRAAAVATGLKLARPDMQVWVVTGDGDGLSIGGNHLIHALRRNTDVKILLFDNRIYGLTKGQFSPTSRLGAKTRSTPFGSVDSPFNPVSLALGAEATFVARSVAIFPHHLKAVLHRAASHRGSCLVQIFQNCNVFNDGAFDHFTDKTVRDDNTVVMEHAKPLIYGKHRDRGIRLKGRDLEAVRFEPDNPPEDLLVHHEEEQDATIAYILSRMRLPEFPVPIGIFRDVKRPSFSDMVREQLVKARERSGEPDLQKLLEGPDPWEVH
ncbi:MAG: 2-oxoacid:ferredoxin oxidoreductase subunit beta [Candidatus Eiseniibacteriota bacterium]|jgi:2-oxoglutarate ferredoxin oxidoreductase subunit beta